MMLSSSRPLQHSASSASETYLLGDATLTLSGDEQLRDRFGMVLGDCLVNGRSSPGLDCLARSDGSVAFSYPGDRLNLHSILEAVTMLEGRDKDPAVHRVDGDTIAFDVSKEWRGFAANCAINVAVALQPQVAFFHAASVTVAGRGILISGAKGRGKSTLSLALGGRGHTLLGEEMAAIRMGSREILPMRRAASIRDGIRSPAVDARLAQVEGVIETYPDGSPRLRVRISDLFPQSAPEIAPLSAIFFLRSFSREPAAERFAPSFADTGLLQPLGGEWQSAARRFRLLQLLTTTPCFHLDAADPDATAASIEQLLEAL